MEILRLCSISCTYTYIYFLIVTCKSNRFNSWSQTVFSSYFCCDLWFVITLHYGFSFKKRDTKFDVFNILLWKLLGSRHIKILFLIRQRWMTKPCWFMLIFLWLICGWFWQNSVEDWEFFLALFCHDEIIKYNDFHFNVTKKEIQIKIKKTFRIDESCTFKYIKSKPVATYHLKFR